MVTKAEPARPRISAGRKIECREVVLTTESFQRFLIATALDGNGIDFPPARYSQAKNEQGDLRAGCRFFVGMQDHHRLLEPTLAEQGNHGQTSVYAVINQRLFFLARAVQYEVDHGLLQLQFAGMTDAYAQSPVILCAERSGDVLKSIVSAG